jgi:hypothetical protein
MTMTFEQWKAKVEEVLRFCYGVSADDLPDVDYYSMWEDDVSPRNAARRAIRNAMEC